ncbi:MAG TPA: hypothetical protein VFY70_12360 [Thermomicrobiales bacterium]|nr:hypothetical protein [Thermomicrobiales bacterium]
MDEAQSPGSGEIGAVRRLVDRPTAAKTYLTVLRWRLRRGEVAPTEVEEHLVQVERQLDDAAAATEEMKHVVEPTA